MTFKPDLHVAPHGLPLASHRASRLCPCGPVECVELLGGPLGRVIYVHHDVPQRPQTAQDTRRPAP